VVALSSRSLEYSSRVAERVITRIRAWQVFIVSLTLRLVANRVRGGQPVVYTENLKAGFTLAKHGYLGDPFRLPTGPTAHLSPAYPVLVAAVRGLTPSDAICVRVLSIVLAVVTSANIAALVPVSRALGLPRGSGAIAAIIWVIPCFFWIELSAEHETPLTVLALLALVTVIVHTAGTARATLATGAKLGLVAGVAAYFTPLTLPAGALTTVVAARLCRWSVRGWLITFTAALFSFAVVIAPYTLRNYRDFGAWFFMRDNFGLELAVSNGPTARATMDENEEAGGSMTDHPFHSKRGAEELRSVGEIAYNHQRERAAFDWIESQPRAFLTLVIQRAGYLVLPYSNRPSQIAVAGGIALAAIAGGVLLWRSRYRFGIQCLTGALAGYLFVYLIVQQQMRYTYPALFLESLIVGSGVAVLLRRFSDRRGQDQARGAFGRAASAPRNCNECCSVDRSRVRLLCPS